VLVYANGPKTFISVGVFIMRIRLFCPKKYLKVHLHEFFVLVLVFCTDQTYIGQIIRLSIVFNFVLGFAYLFKFFNIQR
jgi:hypothetical protein